MKLIIPILFRIKILFLLFIFCGPGLFAQLSRFSIQNNYLNGDNIFAIGEGQSGRMYLCADTWIYTSSNNGDAWKMNYVNNYPYTWYSIMTAPNGTTYFGVAGNVWPTTTSIWKTTDNGITFQPTSLQGYFALSIAINNSNEVFVGTKTGVMKTTDGGTTFEAKNSGLGSVPVEYLVINKNNGYLFAATRDDQIFRSTDNGNSWTLLKSYSNLNATRISASLVINQSNGYLYYAMRNNWEQYNNDLSNNDIFVSTDNGVSWNSIYSNMNRYVNTLALDKNNNLFVGTDNGVYKYNGTNWDPYILQNNNINRIYFNNNNDFFGSIGSGPLYRQLNNSSNIEMIFNIKNYNNQIITSKITKYVFLATGAGVYRSDNLQVQITEYNSGLTCTFINTLAIDNNDVLYAGTRKGLFKSLDYGANWSPTNLNTQNIKYIHITQSGAIYAATNSNQIYVSTDGSSFLAANLNQNVNFLTSYTGTIYATTNDGVYYSSNLGNTWNQSTNMKSTKIYSIANDSKGNLFATTDNGLYKSVDGGNNWIEPVLTVNTKHVIINSNDNIFVGYDHNLYRSTDNGVSWAELVYPDPWDWNNIRSLCLNKEGLLLIGTMNRVLQSVKSTVMQSPKLVNPSNTSLEIPLKANLVWNDASDKGGEYDTRYIIQISTDQNFSTKIIDQKDYTDTTYTTGKLNGHTKYYWRISGNDVCAVSPWSNTNEFTTINLPNIKLDTNVVKIFAKQNDTLPKAVSVTIKNDGGGALNWNITKNVTWMNVTPTVGTNNTSINIRVNTTNLASGTYYGTLTISDSSASNSPITLVVIYIIGDPPYIILNQDTLKYYAVKNGPIPGRKTFNIINGGIGTINWSITNSSNWLSVSPKTGADYATINVDITNTNFPLGTYYDTIKVSSLDATNSPQIIVVKYYVLPQPTIGLGGVGVDSTLTFSVGYLNRSAPIPLTFNIFNSGDGMLNWNIAIDSNSWLKVIPSSGVDSGRVSVEITSTKQSIGVGNHQAKLTISDPMATNNPKYVYVKYFLDYNPEIKITNPGKYKDTLLFQAIKDRELPIPQSFSISNIGSGVLNWIAQKSENWLSIDSTSGTNTGTVRVSITKTNLEAGVYITSIMIVDPKAINSPYPIFVKFVIEDKPRIFIQPDSIMFTAIQNSDLPTIGEFNIRNVGSGTLHWKIQNDSSWVTVNPISDSVDKKITLKINTTSLPLGLYKNDLIISDTSASNNPQKFRINYSVEKRPEISCTPTKLKFIAVQNEKLPSPQIVKIDNLGGYELNVKFNSKGGWIEKLPNLKIKKSDSIQVSINTTNMSPGTYTTQIEVSDTLSVNKLFLIDIEYSVVDRPNIVIDPGSIIFTSVKNTSLPPDQFFIIKSSINKSVKCKIDVDTSWLKLNKYYSETILDTIYVKIKTNQDTGLHITKILISDSNALNSPRSVLVSYFVKNPSFIKVDPKIINFSAVKNDSLPQSKYFSVSNIGEGILNCKITVDQNWFTTEKNSVQGNYNDVNVLIKTTDLPVGRYTGSVKIADSLAENKYVTINIVYNILRTSDLLVTPQLLEFSAMKNDTNPPPKSFMVTNNGDGILDSKITSSSTWLNLGTNRINSNQSKINVGIKTTNLPIGSYSDTIFITDRLAANSPQKIIVNYLITEQPQLSIDRNELEFSATKGCKLAGKEIIKVTNRGKGQMLWEVSSPDTWIEYSPEKGIDDGDVTIGIKNTDMEVGTYTGNVIITSIGSSNIQQIVKVVYKVSKIDERNIYMYPNPFKGGVESGHLRYVLCSDGKISIRILDKLGQVVKDVIREEDRQSGREYIESWDGRNNEGSVVVNGVYYYVFEIKGAEKIVGKIVILK